MNETHLILFAEIDARGEPIAYFDEPASGRVGRWIRLMPGTVMRRPQGEQIEFVDSTGVSRAIEEALHAGIIADESSRRQHAIDVTSQIAAQNAVWSHLIWTIVFKSGESPQAYELATTHNACVLYRDSTELGRVASVRWWAPLTAARVRDLAEQLGRFIPSDDIS